jgi:hypothetical protein
MPQKRISICTSVSVGSRRAIVVDASGDVALAAENAFALYMASEYALDGRFDMRITPFFMQNTPFLAGRIEQIRKHEAHESFLFAFCRRR